MHGYKSRLFLAAEMPCGQGASRLGQIQVIKSIRRFQSHFPGPISDYRESFGANAPEGI